MASEHYQLSPRLLSVVTKVPMERLPDRLTPSMFKGPYSGVVMKNRRAVKEKVKRVEDEGTTPFIRSRFTATLCRTETGAWPACR